MDLLGMYHLFILVISLGEQESEDDHQIKRYQLRFYEHHGQQLLLPQIL